MEENTKGAHADILGNMSPEERIMHIVASGLMLNRKLEAVLSVLKVKTMFTGTDVDDMMAEVPVPILIQFNGVIGELLDIMKEHNLYQPEKIQGFIDGKRAQMEAKAKAEGRPEGWCEACGVVHNVDEDDEAENGVDVQNPLAGIASVIMSMMAARKMQAKMESGEAEDAPPPGAPIH